MLYTVKEAAGLAGITVKALHYYHRIGLLPPAEVSEAGYRLYGASELERLQQILLYRELDFPLEQIARLLAQEPDRERMLIEQQQLLQRRKERLETIIATIHNTLAGMAKGEPMKPEELFRGLDSEEAWREALQPQKEHLREIYQYELSGPTADEVPRLNEAAREAAGFMEAMAGLLREGVSHASDAVSGLLREHLAFLNDHGHSVTPEDFAAQNRFFLGDEFHRNMLESQQTGLAYFLAAAADAYAMAEGPGKES
ncbi:MerR family transcriptional regulator ['Paenibacillus yunnanensis' Narsing Rao et al. 2020]|uniref:MerR family transcriptional regulator n=1 Tax=Paenibacillus tengchongensis TaxID=2608684 RepID=UPI00124D5993|nr:MerR family transcriptional regulator [Paenibacillus tengchongensis]